MRLIRAINYDVIPWGFYNEPFGTKVGNRVIPFREKRQPLTTLEQFGRERGKRVIQHVGFYDHTALRVFQPASRMERYGLVLWEVRPIGSEAVTLDARNALKVIARAQTHAPGRHAHYVLAVLRQGTSIYAERGGKKLELYFYGRDAIVLSEGEQALTTRQKTLAHLNMDGGQDVCARAKRLPKNAVVLITNTANPITTVALHQILLNNPACRKVYVRGNRLDREPIPWIVKDIPP